MAAIARKAPILSGDARATSRAASARPVATWLLVVAAMVFIMVVIGGLTRLTESGLSIVEWQPILGVLPPLAEADWRSLFEKYQQTPQYRSMFPDMTLAEFKQIFWPEYVHRLWGRLIGLAFALPLVWFWALGRIPPGLLPGLLLLLLLGAAQGALGWLMVASGLVDRPSVSHYRLAAHLALAIVIFAICLWLALGLIQPRRAALTPMLRWPWRAFVALAAATLLYGAFVAGLRAGWIHNTFPLMGGALVPSGYWLAELGWLNLFENHDAVQFNHRVLATLTLLSAALLFILAFVRSRDVGLRRGALLLLGAVALQYALGAATILIFGAARPPLTGGVAIGTLHQAGAMIVVGATVWFMHVARSPYRSRPTRSA